MCDMHSDFLQKFDALIQKVDVLNADSVARYDLLLGRIVKLEETLAKTVVAQSQPPPAPAALLTSTDDSGPADVSGITHLIFKAVGKRELLRKKV